MTLHTFFFSWCSRKRSGEVGFRICDDVTNVFSSVGGHASDLHRSVSESVMTSHTFFISSCSRKRFGEVDFRICDDVAMISPVGAHAGDLERSVSESVMHSQIFSKNRCSRLSFVTESMLTLAFWRGRFQNL